jgi:hypothetical protein
MPQPVGGCSDAARSIALAVGAGESGLSYSGWVTSRRRPPSAGAAGCEAGTGRAPRRALMGIAWGLSRFSPSFAVRSGNTAAGAWHPSKPGWLWPDTPADWAIDFSAVRSPSRRMASLRPAPDLKDAIRRARREGSGMSSATRRVSRTGEGDPTDTLVDGVLAHGDDPRLMVAVAHRVEAARRMSFRLPREETHAGPAPCN